MPESYTPGYRFPLVPQPRPRPRLLVKREAAATVKTKDQAERDLCRARSGGRCEVVVSSRFRSGAAFLVRCGHRATQNHHLIGGSGRRNTGRSILAAHRLHVCDRCHADITGKILIPMDGTTKEDAATVLYERVK